MSSPPFLSQSYTGQFVNDELKYSEDRAERNPKQCTSNISRTNPIPFNISKRAQRRRPTRRQKGSVAKKLPLSRASKPSQKSSTELQSSLIENDEKLNGKIPHVTLIKLDHMHDLSIKYRRKLNVDLKPSKNRSGQLDGSRLKKKKPRLGSTKNTHLMEDNSFENMQTNFPTSPKSTQGKIQLQPSTQKCQGSRGIPIDSLGSVAKNLQEDSARLWSADCIVCNEIFTDRLELHKHATLSHSNTKIFFCDFCGKTFLREVALQEHRIAIHRVKVTGKNVLSIDEFTETRQKVSKMLEIKMKRTSPALTSKMQASSEKQEDRATPVNTLVTAKNICRGKPKCLTSLPLTGSTNVFSQISSNFTKLLKNASASKQAESVTPILRNKKDRNTRAKMKFRHDRNLLELRKRRILKNVKRNTGKRLNTKASNISMRSSEETEQQSILSELEVGSSRLRKKRTRSQSKTPANNDLAKTLQELSNVKKVDCTNSENVTTLTPISDPSLTIFKNSEEQIKPAIKLDYLRLNNPISNKNDEILQEREDIPELKRNIRNIKGDKSDIERNKIPVELSQTAVIPNLSDTTKDDDCISTSLANRSDKRTIRAVNAESFQEQKNDAMKKCNVTATTDKDVRRQSSTVQISPKDKKEHDFKTKSCIAKEKLIRNNTADHQMNRNKANAQNEKQERRKTCKAISHSIERISDVEIAKSLETEQTSELSSELHGKEKNTLLSNEGGNQYDDPVIFIYSGNSNITDGSTQNSLNSTFGVKQGEIEQNNVVTLSQLNDTLTCKLCRISFPSEILYNSHMLYHQKNAGDNPTGVVTTKHAQIIVPRRNKSQSRDKRRDNMNPRSISGSRGNKRVKHKELSSVIDTSNDPVANDETYAFSCKHYSQKFVTLKDVEEDAVSRNIKCGIDKSSRTVQSFKEHRMTHEIPTMECVSNSQRSISSANVEKYVTTAQNFDETFKQTSTTPRIFDAQKINPIRSTQVIACEYCPQTFVSVVDHKKHLVEIHLSCGTCNRVFETVKGLKLHEANHRRTVFPFKCYYCPEQFNGMHEVVKHTEETHPACVTCNIFFSTVENLKQHEAMHPKCTICNGVFPTVESLRMHEKMHFAYAICNTVFITEERLEKHAKTHLRCTTCNIVCKTVKKLRVHEKTHPVCTICKTVFLNVEILRKHEEMHLTCVICNTVFPTMESLQKHENTHLTCAICYSDFPTVESTRVHESTHPTCAICNAGFLVEESLKKHEETHPTCETCKAAFLTSENLKKHEETHPTCVICNAVFLTRESLSEHEVTHPTCTTCNALFLTVENLKKHEKTHPTCGTCNAVFLTVESLEKHKATHPTCITCNAVLLTVDSLKKHEETHPICGTCNVVMLTMESLKKHETMHPVCEKCHVVFPNAESLKKHAIKHLTCKVCNTVYLTEECFKIHEGIHPICKTCKVVFPTAEILKKHKALHPTCKTCNAAYLTAEGLEKHEVIHLKCKTCNATYRTAMSLKKHEESHPKCRTCNAIFPAAESLKEHEQTHPICKTCKRVFQTVDILEKHEAMNIRRGLEFQCRYSCEEKISILNDRSTAAELDETSAECSKAVCIDESVDKLETTYEVKQCEFCPKQFISLKHLETHVTIKHKTCILCKEVFPTVMSYEEHKANHLQQTVKTCPYCPQNFLSEEKKRIHVIKEHKTCKTCRRIFKNKKACDSHQVIHGLKNITPKCYYCPEKFSSVEDVRSHIKKVHKTCMTCKQEFSTVANLLKHRANGLITEKVTLSVGSEKHIGCDVYTERLTADTEIDQNEGESCKLNSNANDSKPKSMTKRKVESVGNPDEDKVAAGLHNSMVVASEHVRLESNSGEKSCLNCLKTFDSLGALLAHQKQHLITCTVCNQGFTNFQIYSHHTQKHNVPTSIQCDMQWRKMDTNDGEICMLEPVGGTPENMETPLRRNIGEASNNTEHILRCVKDDFPLLEQATQSLGRELVSDGNSSIRKETNIPSTVDIVQENVIDSSFREEPLLSTTNVTEATKLILHSGDVTLSAHESAQVNEYSCGTFQKNENLCEILEHYEISKRDESVEGNFDSSQTIKLETQKSCRNMVSHNTMHRLLDDRTDAMYHPGENGEANHSKNIRMTSVKRDNITGKQWALKMSRIFDNEHRRRTRSQMVKIDKSKIPFIPKRMKPGVRSIEKVYTCTQCYQLFIGKEKLAEHQLRDHSKTPKSDETQVTCMICDRKFTELDMLAVHITSIHGIDEMHALDMLEAHLTSTDGVEQILKSKKIEFSCPICKSSFVSEDMLLEHSSIRCNPEQTQPERTFCCLLCNAQCKTNDHLKAHLLKHSETRKTILDDEIVCPICNAIFDMPESLNAHLETHDKITEQEEERKDCSKKMCGKEFNSSCHRTTTLNSPESSIIPEGQEFFSSQTDQIKVSSTIFTCFVCSAQYNTEDELKIHVHSHGSRQCKICTLQSEEVFQAHIDGHMQKYYEDGGLISCVHCKFEFDTMQNYKKHQREKCSYTRPEHMMTKRSCTICKKVMFFKMLCDHKSLYYKPIFVKCAACSETFRSLFTLILHRYECELWDHSCKTCAEKFWSEVELEQHIVTVHKVMARSCTFCDGKFESVANLRNHEREHIVHDEGGGKIPGYREDRGSMKLKSRKCISNEIIVSANSTEYETVKAMVKEANSVTMEVETVVELQNFILKGNNSPSTSWTEEVTIAEYHKGGDLWMEEVKPPVRKKAKKVGSEEVSTPLKTDNSGERSIVSNRIQNVGTDINMFEKSVDANNKELAVDAPVENNNRAIDLIKIEERDNSPEFENTIPKLFNDTSNRNNSNKRKLVKHSSDLVSAMDDSAVNDRQDDRQDDPHATEMMEHDTSRADNSISLAYHCADNYNTGTKKLMLTISEKNADDKNVSKLIQQSGSKSKSISRRNIAIQTDGNVEDHAEDVVSHEIESVVFTEESEHSILEFKEESEKGKYFKSDIFDAIQVKLRKSTYDKLNKRKSFGEPTPFSDGISLKKSHIEKWTRIEKQVKQYSCKTCGKRFQTQKSFDEHKFYLHDETLGEINSHDSLIRSSTFQTISDPQRSEGDVSKVDDVSNFSSAELLMDWSHTESFKQPHVSTTNESEEYDPQAILELDHRGNDDESNTNVVMCERCGKTFDGNLSLEKHKSLMHETKSRRVWGCRYCKNIFESLHECHLHRYIAHDDASSVHICENCGQILTSVAMVNVHICSGVLSWYCKPCDLNFESGMELKVHNTILHMEHTGPHDCDVCLKTFMTSSMMNRHKSTKHENIECKSCQVTFLIQEAFDQHRCGRFESGLDDTVDTQLVLPSETRKSFDQKNCEAEKTEPKSIVGAQQIVPSVTQEAFHLRNGVAAETEPKDAIAAQQSFEQETFDQQKCGAIITEPEATVAPQQVVTFIIQSDCDQQQNGAEKAYLKTPAAAQQIARNIILECEECGEGFRTKTSLRRHILQQHNTPLVCNVCQMIFVHSESLEEHRCGSHTSLLSQKMVTDPADTWCQLCQKYFVYGLTRHMYRVHEDESGVHVCDNCGRILISVASVNTHNCRTAKAWYCKRCCLSLNSGAELTSHNNEFHYEVPGPYQCLKCQQVFITKAMLYRHERWRHGLFDCELCKATFITQSARNVHKCQIRNTEAEAEQRNKTKSQFCEICNKIFASQAKLKAHNRRVHQETPQVCEVCNIIFMLSASLKEHMRTVHGTSNTTRKSMVNNHEKTVLATNDGRTAQSVDDKGSGVSCEVCGMYLESEQHLRLHKYHIHAEGIGKRVTVQEITNFVATCSICDKGFRSMGSLRCHQFWLHDIDCLICNIEFTSSRLAANHKIETHEGLANYMRETRNISDYKVSTNPAEVVLKDRYDKGLKIRNLNPKKVEIGMPSKADRDFDAGVLMEDFGSTERANLLSDTSEEMQTQYLNSSELFTNDNGSEICDEDTMCTPGNDKKENSESTIMEILAEKHHGITDAVKYTYENDNGANKISLESLDRNNIPSISLAINETEQLVKTLHCEKLIPEQTANLADAGIVPRVIVLTKEPKLQLTNEGDVITSRVDVGDTTKPASNLIDSFSLDQQIRDTDTKMQDLPTNNHESSVKAKDVMNTQEPYVATRMVAQSTFEEKADIINIINSDENFVRSTDNVSGAEQCALDLPQSTVEEIELKLGMSSMLNFTLQLHNANSSENVLERRNEVRKIMGSGNGPPHTQSKPSNCETVETIIEKNIANASDLALGVIRQNAETWHISQQSKQAIDTGKIASPSHNSSAAEFELSIRRIPITDGQVTTASCTEDDTHELESDQRATNLSNPDEVKEIFKPLVNAVGLEHVDETSAIICLQSNIITTFGNEVQREENISSLSRPVLQSDEDTRLTANQTFESLMDTIVASEINLEAREKTFTLTNKGTSLAADQSFDSLIRNESKCEASNSRSSSSFAIEDYVKSKDELENNQSGSRKMETPVPLNDNDRFSQLQLRSETQLKNADGKLEGILDRVEGRTNEKKETLFDLKVKPHKTPCLSKDLFIQLDHYAVHSGSIKGDRKTKITSITKYDLPRSNSQNITTSKRRRKKKSHSTRRKVSRGIVKNDRIKIYDSAVLGGAADVHKPSTSKQMQGVTSTDGMLTCPYCQKIFLNKDSYYGHMSAHLDSII